MDVKRVILLALLVAASAFSLSNAEKIQDLDRRIEQLQDMKRGFEGKAIRAENQADRLQFQDNFVLETRRYYRIADENWEKAALIQEEINRLEAEKLLLQEK